MSAEIDAGNREEPVVDLLATFQSRAHGLVHYFGVLDEERRGQLAALREEFEAYKEEVCELKAGRVWLRRVVSESRSAEAALKEEVTKLRLALDSEAVSDRCQCGEAFAGASSSKEFEELRMQLGGLEWRLDNLAEDFGELVDGLKDAGVLVLGRDEAGETLVASAPALAVEQNFKEGKEAGNE